MSPTSSAPLSNELSAARVVAVVVTWNRRELLTECLDALRGQTHPPEVVVVIDNDSTDGTAEQHDTGYA